MMIAPVDSPSAATIRAGMWTDEQVVALLRNIARLDISGDEGQSRPAPSRAPLPAHPAEAIIHFTVAQPAFSAADLARLCRNALRRGRY